MWSTWDTHIRNARGINRAWVRNMSGMLRYTNGIRWHYVRNTWEIRGWIRRKYIGIVLGICACLPLGTPPPGLSLSQAMFSEILFWSLPKDTHDKKNGKALSVGGKNKSRGVPSHAGAYPAVKSILITKTLI
jgi:hypothetical protein